MALRAAVWFGGILGAAGAAALIGYGAYAVGREFFGSDEAPLVVKIAIPAIIGGLVILLLTAVIDRVRRRADSRIERSRY